MPVVEPSIASNPDVRVWIVDAVGAAVENVGHSTAIGTARTPDVLLFQLHVLWLERERPSVVPTKGIVDGTGRTCSSSKIFRTWQRRLPKREVLHPDFAKRWVALLLNNH